MRKINLKIDGNPLEIEEGKTLLEAARSIAISIPTLCYHPALEPFGSCRLCSVEIERNGRKKIVTACNYPVEEGLIVQTNSVNIIDIRKMLLEFLLARCPKERKIQDLAREYGIKKPRFELEDDACILCGLCTRTCEELVGVSAINVINRGITREVDTPYRELSDDCIGCGMCALVCPTDAINRMKNIYPTTAENTVEIEDRFLTGKRDVELGTYSELLACKTSINGQDGGLVTSLLIAGMKNNFFDCAIVVQSTEGYFAEAAIVNNFDEIKRARGSKYLRIPIVRKLEEALKMGKRRIAVVGIPCQVRTVRNIQLHSDLEKEFPGTEIAVIGLFCFESFDYRGLKENTFQLLGVDLDRADKTQIARGKYIVTVDGRKYSCSVKELEKVVREGCSYCNDFVSRLADISIGSVGSPDGYSTAIVRSSVGKKLLDATSFQRAEVNSNEIAKLEGLKRKRADVKISEVMDGLSGILKVDDLHKS